MTTRSAKITSVRPTRWTDLQPGDLWAWGGEYCLVIQITRKDEKWAKLVFLRNGAAWETVVPSDEFPQRITWFPLNSEDDS